MKQAIEKLEAMSVFLKKAIETGDPEKVNHAAEVVSEDLQEYADDLKTVFKIYLIVKGERIVSIKKSAAALTLKELSLDPHKIEGVTVYTDYDKAVEDAHEVKDSRIVPVAISGKLAQQKLEFDDAPAGQTKMKEVEGKLVDEESDKYFFGGIKEGETSAEDVQEIGSEEAVIAHMNKEKESLKKDFVSVEYFRGETRIVVPVASLDEFIEEKIEEFAAAKK